MDKIKTTLARRLQRAQSRRRKAVVAVFTAVMGLLLLAFAALAVDVGAMYSTRADLQRAADAGSMAAASVLSGLVQGEAALAARTAARDAVEQNLVLGRAVTVDDSDITIGRANFNADTGQFNFTPTDLLADAVRVRVRQTEGSPNGPAPLYFAKAFGRTSANIEAEAIAFLGPRDIAITVDTSGSTNDDSELRHYLLTPINLRDVWGGLPNNNPVAIGEDDLLAPPDPMSGAGELEGPAWGFMRDLGWGTELDPDDYDPTTDGGLIKLQYDRDWNDVTLSAYLALQGYSPAEIVAINSRQYDANGTYDERVAVALGFAFWNSGMAGGLWESRGVPAGQTGNGNTYIAASELEWSETLFDNSVSDSRNIWRDYINNYVSRSNTAMAGANSAFRYRYGVKTFVNYLLERRTTYAQTPELADTDAQPVKAVKDAVSFMVGLIDGMQTSDQMSLVVYATTAHLEVPLTDEFHLVSERINQMQAGYYDTLTNMGGGLQAAIAAITGEGARAMSQKVIVMMSDGVANVDADGHWGESGGAAHALALAEQAADMGIQIHTISFGAAADQAIMAQIAAMGHGKHFHAEGTIEEYSAGLADIFQTIGMSRTVELIQ